MDYVNNIITSSDADVFFGNNMSLRNLTLASTLRFIALKHHQGEIETIKAIKAESMEFYTHNSGNAYAQHAKDNGIELLILTAPRGAQLLTITEDGWASLDTLSCRPVSFGSIGNSCLLKCDNQEYDHHRKTSNRQMD